MPSQPRSLPAALRVFLPLAVGLAFLLSFQFEAAEVRFSNIDDLDCYAVTQSDTLLSYIDWMSSSQARFYQFVNLGFVDLLNRIESGFWFHLHRTMLLALEFALGAWLLARLAGDAAAGWMFWVVGLGALQIPPGYYPVLSYPPIAFGFVALLAAALAFDEGLMTGRKGLLVGAGVCFFAAMLFHDIFVVFAPVFPLIQWLRHGWRRQGAATTLLPPAVAVGLYLTIYFGYRWSVVAAHSYDGTAASFELWPALVSWFRFTFSVVPGFELWFHRAGAPGGPTWHDLPAVLATLREGMTAGIWLRALGTTAAAALLGTMPIPPASRRRLLGVAAGAAGLALITNLPIAITQKYQVWAFHREIPYAYSFFCCFFGWAAAIAVFRWFYLSYLAHVRPLARGLAIGVALASVFLASFAAQITNAGVYRHLLQKYNSPAAATAPR